MYNRRYTPERITHLKENEIFVFGSNLAGSHGGGAARQAYNCFGAVWGQGVGLQGQSYAIPTMHGGVEAIELIGGGWVGDEALAIALYCAAKYFDDFEKAMIAAVNHSGDSDSTGAITGNILGAVLGYEALPDFYKKDLELHDVILAVADDLWEGKRR